MPTFLPDPGTLFPVDEQPRVVETARRYAILMEDFDAIAEAHIAQHIPPDRRVTWPRPDTSKNPLAAVCRAMSTPGHYGRQPMLVGPDADAVRDLLDGAGLWPLCQHVEYLAWGLGACVRTIDLPASLGRLVFGALPPCYVWAEAHPDDPRLPVVMYRLRRRMVRITNAPEEAYCWDIHDVRDPAGPKFSIRLAEPRGVLGADVTSQLFDVPEGGDPYPWRGPDGAPILPYEIQRKADTGDMWGWQAGRGATLGTLNAVELSTMALKTARDATGKKLLVAGVTPLGTKTRAAADGSHYMSVQLDPGEALFCAFQESGQQPWSTSFGDGENLEPLSTYLEQYSASIGYDLGVTPTDATRVGANPMSGVALSLTNASKRAEQRRMEPLCRAADSATIRKALALAQRYGVAGALSVPLVVYHEIERSPDEERQEREAQEWAVANGQASPVDVYISRNPGASREQAIADLARIRRDMAEIEAASGFNRSAT